MAKFWFGEGFVFFVGLVVDFYAELVMYFDLYLLSVVLFWSTFKVFSWDVYLPYMRTKSIISFHQPFPARYPDLLTKTLSLP